MVPLLYRSDALARLVRPAVATNLPVLFHPFSNHNPSETGAAGMPPKLLKCLYLAYLQPLCLKSRPRPQIKRVIITA